MSTQIIEKVMKQVMHQVQMHCKYITTEAMTTAQVEVFYAMYFKTVGYSELISTIARI